MHASHYAWHPETTVRAVADTNPDAFSSLDARLPFLDGVQRATDVDAILARKDVELVSVCTPDHTHAEYAVAALEAGKHVLCEKPMATTIEDSLRIVRAAEVAKGVFCVFQQMRFVPRNVAVKRLLDSGNLGEIIYIETGYVHDMRRRMTEFSRWRLDPDTFQAPILGACHHIDLVRWLAGEITEVCTIGTHRGIPEYPVDDTYVTSFRLADGAAGSVLTCLGPRVPREFHPLRLYATRGTVQDGTVFFEDDTRIVERPLRARPYLGVPDFRSQIAHFIDCVRGRAQPMVTATDGARTVAACLAATESWRERRPVPVPNLT